MVNARWCDTQLFFKIVWMAEMQRFIGDCEDCTLSRLRLWRLFVLKREAGTVLILRANCYQVPRFHAEKYAATKSPGGAGVAIDLHC